MKAMEANKTKEKKKSLAAQFAVLFGIMALLAVLISGTVTYVNQTKLYQKDCINSLKQMTGYMDALIAAEDDEFVFLKSYFDEHPDKVCISVDFREKLEASEEAFYEYAKTHYDGRVPTAGLAYDEMDEEAQRLYVDYRFKYWFTKFFDAADEFGLSYVYFIYPEENEDHKMVYMFDPSLVTTTDKDGNEILLLGESVFEDPAIHEHMWKAWESGEPQDSVDSVDNKYGYVYTYCRPLTLNGEKIGLICADADVDRINADIRDSVIRQDLAEALIFFIAMILLYLFLKLRLLDRIAKLMKGVRKYSDDKDPTLAGKISAIRGQNDEIGALSDSFAGMITSLEDYMNELQEVTAEKERIGAELHVATQIQADMLPNIFPAFPERDEFNVFATMTPAKEVGGDFYDFFFVDEDHIALVMADVSGKGVPAALFMVIAKTLIKSTLQNETDAAAALADVNDKLCDGNNAGLFVTVWMAVIDLRTGESISLNAGHEHPAFCKKGGEYALDIYRHSPAVAAMEGMMFKERRFTLDKGERLFVYTDGVAEATNANNELFGTDRMLVSLNEHKEGSLEEQLYGLKESIDEFVGDAPQFDDITMLLFEYHGKES